MRYRRLDLNLLIALDALLSDRSVTKAAAKLNITQPAMSGALARLREYFEDALVIQVGRQMELTPLAQSLVGPIHDVIMRIDSAIATEAQFDPARSKRHFAVTASDYVIRVFLREALARMHRVAPGISFDFRQSTGRVQEELESGEVDFVIGPEIDVLAEHPKELLFEDTYTVIAWKDSTAVGNTLSLDEYMSLKHVVFRSEHRGIAWLERWFASRYGDVRQIDVATASFMLLPHLVVDTDRIATVQTRLAKTYLHMLPIRMVEPTFELPKLTEILQWNVHRDPDPAFRWLRSMLKEQSARLEKEQ
jgi:LysR family transcriptional regulator, nod-box dependent transcriptional activator